MISPSFALHALFGVFFFCCWTWRMDLIRRILHAVSVWCLFHFVNSCFAGGPQISLPEKEIGCIILTGNWHFDVHFDGVKSLSCLVVHILGKEVCVLFANHDRTLVVCVHPTPLFNSLYSRTPSHIESKAFWLEISLSYTPSHTYFTNNMHFKLFLKGVFATFITHFS